MNKKIIPEEGLQTNSIKLRHLMDSFSCSSDCGAALYIGKSQLFYQTGFTENYLAGHMEILLALFRQCESQNTYGDDYIYDNDSGLAAKAIISKTGNNYSIMGYFLVNPGQIFPDNKKKQLAICSLLRPLCTFIVSEGYLSVFYQRQVAAFHQIVWDYPDNNWTISSLCKIFGISKTALYESFSTYTGMTVAEYIKSIRLEKAKYLMDTTDYSMTEISDMVGFNDYNYFLRVFKKNFGQSAGSYRKQVKSGHAI